LNWKRKLLVVIAILAVAGGLLYGFRTSPVPAETARVKRGPLKVTVDEEGRTRVIDRYTVTAPITGFMRRVSLKEGDVVHRGGVVAVIEPSRPEFLDPRAHANARAAVDSARSTLDKAGEDLKSARAEANYASEDKNRKQSLYDKGIISLDELQAADARSLAADAALGSAKFAVDVARHELESARTALLYTPSSGRAAPYGTVLVHSPVDGEVLRVHRTSEGPINSSDAIMDVGDPSAIEVAVDVLSDDAVKIRPGMRAVLTRWGGDGGLDAMVRVVEPSGFTKVSALGVEEQRVWVISDITSPREQWKNLKDQYRVEASFIIWEGKDVLQVPESALFRHGDGWAVFLVDGGKAAIRPVVPGRRNGLYAEISSGLSEGDTVIIHPDESISDGSRLELGD
jgi:HlyD family secretion protein